MWHFRYLLTLQIVVTAGLPLLFILTFGLLIIVPQLEDQAEAEHRSLANAMAGQIEAYLLGAGAELSTVARILQDVPQSSWETLLDSQVGNADVYNSIQIVGEDGLTDVVGLPVGLRNTRPNYLGIDFSRRDFYQKMRDTNKASWSDTFLSTSSGKLTVAYSLPMGDSSLVGEIALDRLSSYIGSLTTEDERQALIIDREGFLVAHPDPEMSGQQISLLHLPIVERGLAGVADFSEFNYQHRQLVGAIVQVRKLGWIVLLSQPKALAYRSIHNTYYLISFSLLCGLIVAAIGSVMLARSVSKRFDLFVNNADEIANGNYELNWPSSRIKEFSSLAENLGDMVNAIKSRENEHVKMNRNLSETMNELVSARQQQNQLVDEIEAKNRKLESQNAELERFAYTVSHDLKTPLVTITGFIGMLQNDIARGDSSAINADLGQINEAAKKMGRLLEELLELSRVGRVANTFDGVDLDDLVAGVVDSMQMQLVARNVKLEIVQQLPPVYGDAIRLQEVFQNLIENALKFVGNQQAPKIEIGAQQDGGRVQCYVRDNGIGIAADYQERIFNLFERLDSETEGTGIGLALVKRIVEVHGGTIRVESEGEGKGSTFRFTLPGCSLQHGEVRVAVYPG